MGRIDGGRGNNVFCKAIKSLIVNIICRFYVLQHVLISFFITFFAPFNGFEKIIRKGI